MEAPIVQPESPYESLRLLNNVARLGTIAEVRLAAPARVRVRCGGNVTRWLPWLAHRAGGQAGGRKWHPPVEGEQVLVICPSGDLGQGVALLGVYSDAMDQPSQDAGCERTEWDADNHWQWLAGALEIKLKQSCTITVDDKTTLTLLPDSAVIRAGSAVLTIGPNEVTSNVDIVAGGISLMRHVHGGVESGGDTSGPPQ